MNGDHEASEIMRAVGSLETSVNTLVSQVKEMSNDIKGVTKTCNDFEGYKESRKDIPERIGDLEKTAADYERTKELNQKEQDKRFKQIDFLMIWSYRVGGAILLLQILIGLLVLVLQFIDFKYVVKP